MREKPRSCKTAAELNVGDRIEKPYVISEADLVAFGQISGDWNPLHFDDEYASGTIFKQRIAHGVISLAKFSGIFGMDLPGMGTLWDTQKVKFCAPAYIDVPYTAIAEVVEVEKRRARIATWVVDADGKRILEGEAVVIPISEASKRKVRA